MFRADDVVECPRCGWTGYFAETEVAPAPGGMTHRCPGCGDRGRLKESDADVSRTRQDTLEEEV